jgi:hypothetical protein
VTQRPTTPSGTTKRGEKGESRRAALWLAVIVLALIGGIAGLWKLSKLIATEPKKR